MLIVENFDDLQAEVLQDPVARAAYVEHGLRRELAKQFESALVLSLANESDRARVLAKVSGVPLAEARRMLHQEICGKLPLLSICLAAHALGFEVELKLRRAAP